MIHNKGTNIKRFNLFMEETSVAAGDNIQLTLIGKCQLSQTSERSNNPGTSCRMTPAGILAIFQHLRELFGMEESAEGRIGGSASTSCTTAA